MLLDEKSVIDTYLNGKSLRGTGETFGCSEYFIRSVLKRHGISCRPRGGPNNKRKELDVNRVIELRKYNVPVKAVAKELGVAEARIRAAMDAAGLPRRGRWRSDASLNGVLDDAKVAELKVLRRIKKWPWAQLVKRYGVPRSTLRNAYIGRSWRHVTIFDHAPSNDNAVEAFAEGA